MNTKYIKGSEWIKCDLHIHTPYSIEQNYGDSQSADVWNKFIEDLEALPSDFKIIGINDYIFIEGYRKVLEFKAAGRLQNIDLILPVVEFRIDKFGSVSSENPFKRVNFHIIFSDELSADTIQAQFLNSLSSEYKLFPDYESNRADWGGVITRENMINLGEKLKESSNGALTGSALKIGFQSLNISYTQLIDKLNKNHHLEGKFLTAVGKTEWDAMRWEGSPAEKKSVINSADFVFISSSDAEAYSKSKESLKTQSVNDLLLDCSDAHSFSSNLSVKDRVGNCFTWVKINPTFKGLMYLLYEPNDRIYIGNRPEVEQRVDTNKTRYIKKLIVSQIDDYNESQGVWFKNQEIFPSKELTAIIGNKGKGKSAITDIIGLLGNSRNQRYFSFLHKNKFKKNGLAKNFEGTLLWESGVELQRDLNAEVDLDLEEKVKYLPQSYFEDLCNEIDDNENFKKEINQVVFTHLDETERLGKPTFDEFIELKKRNAEETIESFRSSLSSINQEIIELQKKDTPEYKKSLESKIATINDEIRIHRENKPLNPFPDEDEETDDQKKDGEKGENYKKLQEADIDFNVLKAEEDVFIEQLIEVNSDLTDLTQIRHRLKSESERVYEFRIEESANLVNYNISIDDVYPSPKFNFVPIDKVIADKQNEKLILELQLGKIIYDEEEHKTIFPDSQLLLIKKIEKITALIDGLSKTLDAKEKEQESYKRQLAQWERTIKEKEGDWENPSPGTLKYFNNELAFILEELSEQIEGKKKERIEVTINIYTQKSSIVDIYSKFKANIDKKLEENMDEIKEYKISLDASMQIKNFVQNFLDFIDKGRAGFFYGHEEAVKKIKTIVETVDPNNQESVITFLNDIINKLELKGDEKQNPFTQIKDSKSLQDFYDFLFGLKYLDEKYELKFSGKSIEQLSPGERGAALIVFYLLLDNDDKPLIIDQPEDNLDNQSVFEVLVPFIRQAKKKRQLIIVTHNPNLAVVADAEQIIQVNLDKESNYVFSANSGGIENPLLNKGIVDILEGTKPAFDKRKLKYLSDQYTGRS